MSATPWDIAADELLKLCAWGAGDSISAEDAARVIRGACEAHAADLVLHANAVEKERDRLAIKATALSNVVAWLRERLTMIARTKDATARNIALDTLQLTHEVDEGKTEADRLRAELARCREALERIVEIGKEESGGAVTQYESVALAALTPEPKPERDPQIGGQS